jgi:ankyrin repeat protein
MSYETKTDLMKACFNGQIEKVKFLIETGADVNCEDKCGDTALRFAIQNEHIEVVKLLLSVPKLNLSQIDTDGDTTLGYARWVNNKEIINLLETANKK